MTNSLSRTIPFVFVVALLGCSSEEVTQQVSAEKRFAVAMKLFQEEEYTEAIEEFKIITLQSQGSRLADDAQFYMGECRYMRGEFILAAYEYDVLLRTMPTSEFVSRCRFRKALCYYNLSPESYRDQEYTKKAIDEFQAFLEYNPTDSLASSAEVKINELNTKLAKKDFENGIIYMKMEYYKAATLYFDEVLEKYHDSPYAEPSLLKKAEALYSRKRYEEAGKEVERFLDKYPASILKPDVERLRDDTRLRLQELQNKEPKLPSEKRTSQDTTRPNGS